MPETDEIMQPTWAGAPMQRTQGRYTTAVQVQRPRRLPEVEKSALAEAAMLAEDGFYGWGAGKDHIEGPSVELANALARCWGNCAVEMEPMQETATAWIMTAAFVDLETGFTLTRQFRQSKEWVVHGRHDDARKDDIRFQIGQSKAVRNVILNALPAWLVRRALDQCRGGVRAALEKSVAQYGLEKVQRRALDRLAALGVSEARVLSVMGRRVAAGLTVEDLILLHGNIQALESGTDTIDAVFPAGAEDPGTGAGTIPEGSAGFGGFGGSENATATPPVASPPTFPPSPPKSAPSATGGDQGAQTPPPRRRGRGVVEIVAWLDGFGSLDKPNGSALIGDDGRWYGQIELPDGSKRSSSPIEKVPNVESWFREHLKGCQTKRHMGSGDDAEVPAGLAGADEPVAADGASTAGVADHTPPSIPDDEAIVVAFRTRCDAVGLSGVSDDDVRRGAAAYCQAAYATTMEHLKPEQRVGLVEKISALSRPSLFIRQ